MGQEIADRVNAPPFQVLLRAGVEEQTRDGLRGKAPHRVRRNASSRLPVQHPLCHEAIGGVEDHESSSIDGSKDVFDQTLVAATLFPDRLIKARGPFGDGHAITCTVPLGLCPGAEPTMDCVEGRALGRMVDNNIHRERRQSIFPHNVRPSFPLIRGDLGILTPHEHPVLRIVTLTDTREARGAVVVMRKVRFCDYSLEVGEVIRKGGE